MRWRILGLAFLTGVSGSPALAQETLRTEYEIAYQGGMAKLKMDSSPIEKHQLENGDKFSIGSYNFEFRTEL